MGLDKLLTGAGTGDSGTPMSLSSASSSTEESSPTRSDGAGVSSSIAATLFKAIPGATADGRAKESATEPSSAVAEPAVAEPAATLNVSVCTMPAFDISDTLSSTIDAEEEMIIVDTDANLVPLVNIIKQGLAPRLAHDAGARDALNACIHSSHDSSSIIVGLCMAMWTMAYVARVRANRDLFETLSVVCSIVPWRHVAVTKQVYKSWLISVFRTIIIPFAKIPRGCNGSDGVYVNAALEYFKRVDFFRKTYMLVGGEVVGNLLTPMIENDDYMKASFYMKLISKFDSIGPVVVEMTHHYITLAEAAGVASMLGLDEKHGKSLAGSKTARGRQRSKRCKTTTQFIHPFARADDTRLASFARSIVFFAAHYRLKAIMLGYQARWWVRRQKAQRLADKAMAALVAREEVDRQRELDRVASRARKAASVKSAAAARRAYTMRIVWEPKSRLDRELVMRMEINFPSNSVACGIEDASDDGAGLPSVMRMLRERWLRATM